MSVAPTTFPVSELDPDILAEVVDLRARGHSWEATALAVEWDVADLRRAARHDPNYPAAYELAEREVDHEADAEGLHRLRVLLGDANSAIARDAAEIIARYLTAKRRDATRLEVERIRADARAAGADARRAKAEAKRTADGAEEEDPPLNPERERQIEEITRRHEREYAEKVARAGTPVFLWGGCHVVGSTPPDDTDTPLRVFRDTTVGGREIFWAVTDPVPAHVTDGPFLTPPGCRPTTYPHTRRAGDDAPLA